MKAEVEVVLSGENIRRTLILKPDQDVWFGNQRPNGKEFNWVGSVGGIDVCINNGERYASQLDIDPRLGRFRTEIAKAISDALREWD